MSELKPYKTVVNGYETTLMLSDEDAQARGLTQAKAASADNKMRRVPNKMRTARNK